MKFVRRTILTLNWAPGHKEYYRPRLSLLGKGGRAVVPKITVESAERPFRGRLNAG